MKRIAFDPAWFAYKEEDFLCNEELVLELLDELIDALDNVIFHDFTTIFNIDSLDYMYQIFPFYNQGLSHTHLKDKMSRFYSNLSRMKINDFETKYREIPNVSQVLTNASYHTIHNLLLITNQLNQFYNSIWAADNFDVVFTPAVCSSNVLTVSYNDLIKEVTCVRSDFVFNNDFRIFQPSDKHIKDKCESLILKKIPKGKQKYFNNALYEYPDLGEIIKEYELASPLYLNFEECNKMIIRAIKSAKSNMLYYPILYCGVKMYLIYRITDFNTNVFHAYNNFSINDIPTNVLDYFDRKYYDITKG